MEDAISNAEKTKHHHNFLYSPITLIEIKTMVKTTFKSLKAPGPDKFRNEMLKAGIRFLTAALSKLFKRTLSRYF